MSDNRVTVQSLLSYGAEGSTLEGLGTLLPSSVRDLFRRGAPYKTAHICQGYVQANFVMLPWKYSEDFEEFCKANSGPLPVLFISARGQFDAPPLITSRTPSDIRTDLSGYRVIENGRYSKTIPNLLEYETEIKDFCSYYLGCSFSFYKRLLSAGIPLRNADQKGEWVPSLYVTNIKCKKVGEFDCHQAVSMLPIPAELVQLAFEVTHPLDRVHGAPIHIGDPAAIGIEDMANVTDGLRTNLLPGDVPVFWSCGATVVEAAKSINVPLAFTHAPGCMFISDLLSTDEGRGPKAGGSNRDDQPTVVWLSKDPPLASSLSFAAKDILTKLEHICSDDPGKRNIERLVLAGDLMESALCLSHATSVGIVTGFPVFCEDDDPFETDGPPGAIALGSFLQSLGINVTFIVDTAVGFDKAMESILEKLSSEGIIHKSFTLERYPNQGCRPDDPASIIDFLTVNGDIGYPRFDHLVAIERPGMAADGHYHSYKAKKISHVMSDVLFEVAQKIPTMFTTDIGHGGNELGMGKVYDKVTKHTPNGDEIASRVAADFRISCGVSNWGGYALCFALYVLRSDVIHDRYRRRGIGFPLREDERQKLHKSLPSEKQEEAVLKMLMQHTFKDSTIEVCMAVDGLDFYDVHVPKLKRMMDCVHTFVMK